MQKLDNWYGREFCLGIASDHGGLEKKRHLSKHLRERGITVTDLGPFELDLGDDYPDYAAKLAHALVTGEIDCGILICRTGIGMSIAANRYHGVRAALAESPGKAKISRGHNAANVLVTGGDSMSSEELLATADVWLDTAYSHQTRHTRRLLKIEEECYDEVAPIRAVDPEMATILDSEIRREDEGLELIASENFASLAVRAASGSVMTNKYAEGYPGKRYYNGCEFVDRAESLAIERACRLFDAEAANVQAHSGTQANMAAYFALLEPGDTVLGMSLNHGGHLTHGHRVNFSGRFYNFVGYGVDRQTERIDYDRIEELALEHKPKLVLAGASAYPREIDFERLRAIVDAVDAYLMVDMAHIAGLVAAGVHPSPVPFSDVVTTTTHKTLRGPRGGMILCKKKYIRKINSQIFPGIQGGPLMNTIAGKAICLKEADTDDFKEYSRQVVLNAKHLAQALQKRGFRIVSGGTDNHLMLVDLRPKGVTGRLAADTLDEVHITVNKNLIPFDPENPRVTSGVRIGTPAVTTRGMKEPEMEIIASFIARVIENIDDAAAKEEITRNVAELTGEFPLPRFRL